MITIVGHRGAKGEAPENTAAGFAHARKLGLTEVELDIRLSRDGELVVLHDRDLKRTTGMHGTSLDHDAASLSQMDARQEHRHWPEHTGVPTLAAVFAESHNDLRYQLEVKAESLPHLKHIADQLVFMVNERQMKHRVVITSNHRGFLTYVGKHYPSFKRGYICKRRFPQPIKQANALNVDWLICHYPLVTPRLLAEAQQHGIQVSVWTVNELPLAKRLIEMGVTSLITDFPSAFLQYLASHPDQGTP